MKAKITLVLLLLAWLIGMAIPYLVAALAVGYVFFGQPQPADAERSEAEYYRGIYDVCATQTHQPELCLRSVTRFKELGWYEQPSTGWEWPLPAQEPQPQPRNPAGQEFSGNG